MRLFFWFALKTVLIIQGRFNYFWAVLTQHQGLFCSSHTHQWVGWEYAGKWEGMQPGQLSPADHKHISDHVMPCKVHKAEGKMKEEGDIPSDGTCTKSLLPVMGPFLLWRWLNNLPMGKTWVNSLFWFHCVCMAFASLINLSFSQPMNFLTFSLPILFPVWGAWASGCVGHSCYMCLNHDIVFRLNQDSCFHRRTFFPWQVFHQINFHTIFRFITIYYYYIIITIDNYILLLLLLL